MTPSSSGSELATLDTPRRRRNSTRAVRRTRATPSRIVDLHGRTQSNYCPCLLAEIDLHWHDLRHEAACRWLSRGLDLRAIQLLLGHADLKTTQRYLNVTDEELRKTMQQKLWSRKS